MRTETIARSTNATRQELIERTIESRTWGRVHRLDVRVDDEHIRVSGFVTSYYIKQLTIQAILEAVGSDSKCRIDVNVDVGAADHPLRVQGLYEGS